jgi:LmbE family N-acetylglucosaminyl deacetylase
MPRSARRSLFALLLVLPLLAASALGQPIPEDSVRIIGIFAHPDDGEYKMGGTAARLAQAGHKIKFVSLTNGDAGHHEQGGGALARRRRAEAKEAAERLGIDAYEVLDYHDAELMPTLAVRRDVIRLIREWNADVVIGHRPNDYHPDHRNAGRVVQDAAYMVQVPNVVSRVEPTDGNPVFLYLEDRFTKPAPFEPDVAVPIDTVMSRKIDALDAHASQMYEWLPWVGDYLDEVPETETARREWLGQRIRNRSLIDADVRATLEEWYGTERARTIDFAEAFEVTEYGHQPSTEELRRIFSMLPPQ